MWVGKEWEVLETSLAFSLALGQPLRICAVCAASPRKDPLRVWMAVIGAQVFPHPELRSYSLVYEGLSLRFG